MPQSTPVAAPVKPSDDQTPYWFKIYRRTLAGSDLVWYEDTEYGLVATCAAVAGLVAHIADVTRPVSRIVIGIVDGETRK